jgi:hypothetical protein
MQRKRGGACDVFTVSNLMGNSFEKYLMQNAVHYSLSARPSDAIACTSLLLFHPKKASPKFIADCFLMRLRSLQKGVLHDVETIQALLPSIASHLSHEERETLKLQIVQSKIEALRNSGDDQHFLVAYQEGVKRYPNSPEILATTIGIVTNKKSKEASLMNVFFSSKRRDICEPLCRFKYDCDTFVTTYCSAYSAQR